MAGIKYTIIWLFGLLSTCNLLFAQKPEPPTIRSVSVDPETGFTTITWEPSPTPLFVDYYLVEQLDILGTARAISPPINPAQNSYIITSDEPLHSSVTYVVVAVNDLGAGDEHRSSWPPRHNTIYLEAVFDSCLSSISLNWNNYENWMGSIEEYRLYRWLDNDVYDLLATLDQGINSFELSNLQANQTYELFIEAFHTDGVRSSKSNKTILTTAMSQVPAFINADYATINYDRGIDLSFTVDATSGLSYYKLLRSNSFEGPYTAIDSFTTTGTQITYTDDTQFTSAVYFYKLQVINNCGIGATQSNSANNIILNGSLSDLNAMLEWNEYRDWEGDVDQYRVIRTIGRLDPVTDTLGGTGTTFFNDDINDLVNYLNPEEGFVCYSVVATENPNRYGVLGLSQSNRICFSITPGIRIPNAFIPNDGEPENRVFEPVFSFLPEHYEMTIYNRLGSKIWEGSGAWDGRVNGSHVPEGVYVYFIRVFNYSAEISEFNGKVTVIYR